MTAYGTLRCPASSTRTTFGCWRLDKALHLAGEPLAEDEIAAAAIGPDARRRAGTAAGRPRRTRAWPSRLGQSGPVTLSPSSSTRSGPLTLMMNAAPGVSDIRPSPGPVSGGFAWPERTHGSIPDPSAPEGTAMNGECCDDGPDKSRGAPARPAPEDAYDPDLRARLVRSLTQKVLPRLPRPRGRGSQGAGEGPHQLAGRGGRRRLRHLRHDAVHPVPRHEHLRRPRSQRGDDHPARRRSRAAVRLPNTRLLLHQPSRSAGRRLGHRHLGARGPAHPRADQPHPARQPGSPSRRSSMT